nr:NADH dehydrogenase subunit 4L [Megaginus tataupensis]
MLKVISFCFVFLGMYKMISSAKMITMLISIEMMMVGIFFLMTSSWWMLFYTQSIVSFISIIVIEGVIGLMLITHLFRSLEISSSFTLYF